MDELVAAGARLRAAAPTPPPRFERVADRAGKRRRRRRIERAVAGVVVIALAVAGVLVGVHSTRTSVHIEVPAHHAQTGALSPQMRAHLGLTAPKGWVPFDLGSLRVWVPPQSSELQSCYDNAVAPDRDVVRLVLGPHPNGATACDANANALSVLEIAVPRPGQPRLPAIALGPARIINGLPVRRALRPIEDLEEIQPLDASLTVPADELGQQVLHTIAPSARAVIAMRGVAVSTQGWQTVSWGSVSVRVPPSWTVNDADGKRGHCGSEQPRTITFGEYRGVPSCPSLDPETAVAGELGNYFVIEPESSLSKLPGGARPFQPTTHTVTDDGYDTTISWTISPGGGHIDLTLGPDGRMDAAILASIRPIVPK
jgi:hypothetical protein